MQGRERESEESCPDTDLLPLVIAFFFGFLSLSLDQKLVSLVLERCLSVSHLTYQIGADQGGSTHARRLPTADDCELLFPRAATLPCRGGGGMTDEKEREGGSVGPWLTGPPPSHHDAHAMPGLFLLVVVVGRPVVLICRAC
ncbi:hypothetical protein NW767_007320 [Fusarium falciforme]|uniref:Uncharacterized protein n=1 Tax=Fusarium falciforme TaxID=195108 RepID=A0A9W8RK99_9HYPO|nr:hypothetical protein NW755_000833 [Fusarium falciforme]KAJ4200700.1 hypothetical protein NW767_007320 [Fusarium falciforme]KAJ4262003.1 hypothetical protein NW757_000273 [Fusarium falciforme]